MLHAEEIPWKSLEGSTVLVQTELQEEGASVALLISDHGSGIPHELYPYLFEPFYAGTNSNGLGLGLYLARQIALAHGGQLSVDATNHYGTCIRLTIPTNGNSNSGPLRNLYPIHRFS